MDNTSHDMMPLAKSKINVFRQNASFSFSFLNRYFSCRMCGFQEKEIVEKNGFAKQAHQCIRENCKQSCSQITFPHTQQIAKYPTLNDAQYFLGKLFVELEKAESNYTEIAKHATSKFLDAVDAGKILFCNMGQNTSPDCEKKAYNYALQVAKQGFTKLHIFRYEYIIDEII